MLWEFVSLNEGNSSGGRILDTMEEQGDFVVIDIRSLVDCLNLRRLHILICIFEGHD